MDTSRWIGLALAAGAWSGVLSAAALMGASRANGDRTPTGLNGPSHWFFGEPAVHAQRFSVRHTVVGALTHQASSFLWSAVFASTRLRPAAAAHGHARTLRIEARHGLADGAHAVDGQGVAHHATDVIGAEDGGGNLLHGFLASR